MITPNIVITGAAGLGIGAATVQAAVANGWPVVFSDVLSHGQVNPSLLTRRTLYVQTDVRDPNAMNVLRNASVDFFREQGTGDNPLGVIACAGISRRGDPAAVQMMRDINVGGTVNLLASFREDLLRTRGRFVGFGSIVAAENVAVKGDEEYQATKIACYKIAHEVAAAMGISGFAVFPGAIDTPMTRREQIFAMLLLGAAKTVGNDTSHPLHQKLLAIAGVEAGAAPAAILTGAYGSELTSSPDFAMCRTNLPRYPRLDSPMVAVAYSKFVSYLEGKTRHARPNVIARAAYVLRLLDVVIGPEVVADRLIRQLASGEAPVNGMLRVYSDSGLDHIRDLLGSFAG